MRIFTSAITCDNSILPGIYTMNLFRSNIPWQLAILCKKYGRDGLYSCTLFTIALLPVIPDFDIHRISPVSYWMFLQRTPAVGPCFSCRMQSSPWAWRIENPPQKTQMISFHYNQYVLYSQTGSNGPNFNKMYAETYSPQALKASTFAYYYDQCVLCAIHKYTYSLLYNGTLVN